jgi:hypothetical protein
MFLSHFITFTTSRLNVHKTFLYTFKMNNLSVFTRKSLKNRIKKLTIITQTSTLLNSLNVSVNKQKTNQVLRKRKRKFYFNKTCKNP